MHNLFISSALMLLLACSDAIAQSSDSTSSSPELAPPPNLRVFSIGEVFANAKVIGVEESKLRSAPTIVFIPGILGSKLRFRDYEFGRDPIVAQHLVFDAKPDKQPIADTLNDFSISKLAGGVLDRFSRQDVYGDSLDQLQKLNSGKAVEEFSYDWRADLDDSALALDKWIKGRGLARKPVVFIAHSMGGLVLSRWLQLYRKRTRDEPSIRQIVFVGSPLQGTCEAARMLLDGYRASTGTRTFEAVVTKYIFEDAHAALLTFPSVFQLLPRYSPRQPCLAYVAKDGSEDGQNHHEADFWLGRRGGREGLLVANSKLWPTLVRASGLPEAEYEQRIRAAIASGARFRRELSVQPPTDIQISYLASGDEEMALGYRIDFDRSSSWFRILAPIISSARVSGDGRVLTASAFNLGSTTSANLSRHPVRGTHGSLLKDPSFFSFMRPNVQPLIDERFAIELGGFLAGQQQSFFEKSIMVDPGLSGRFVSGEGMMAQRNIATFNARLLAQGKNVSASELAAFGLSSTTPFTAIKAFRFRSAVLESAAVLDSKVLPTKGFVLLRESRSALGELDLFSDTAIRAGRSSDGIDWKLLGEYRKE